MSTYSRFNFSGCLSNYLNSTTPSGSRFQQEQPQVSPTLTLNRTSLRWPFFTPLPRVGNRSQCSPWRHVFDQSGGRRAGPRVGGLVHPVVQMAGAPVSRANPRHPSCDRLGDTQSLLDTRHSQWRGAEFAEPWTRAILMPVACIVVERARETSGEPGPRGSQARPSPKVLPFLMPISSSTKRGWCFVPDSRGRCGITGRSLLLSGFCVITRSAYMAVMLIMQVSWGLSFFFLHGICIYRPKWILQVVLSLLPVLHVRTRNHWQGKLLALVFPWGEKKVEASSLVFHLGSQVINILSTGHNFQGNAYEVHHKLARFVISISKHCFIR